MNVVIFGAGLVGVTLARHLSEQTHNVTIIDSSREAVTKIQEKIDVQVIQGNASSDDVLEDADIEKADLVFAVTNSDETNIVLTLITHAQNENARIFTRIRGEQYTSKARLWQADRFHNTRIFNPEQAATDAIVQLLTVPSAIEVIPFPDGAIKLAGFKLGHESLLIGSPLRELAKAGRKIPLIVAAEQNGEVHLPSGETVLSVGDRVYITFDANAVGKDMYKLLGIRSYGRGSVIIVGGGGIGVRVGMGLSACGYSNITFIEKSIDRCHVLADMFPDAFIMNADATDLTFLMNLVGHPAALVAVAGREEVNFLVALAAIRQGIPTVIPMLDNESYLALARDYGIESAISPKGATVGEILGSLRKGNIIKSAPMMNGRLQAFMAKIESGSRLAHVTLAKAKIPKGILIAAVVRNNRVTVPNGATLLDEDDHALILCATDLVSQIDDVLAVKVST
ncbi:MAG: Trk system potassium transporter TrkA [Magnetococcus sp. THC-1_WYH]